MRTILGFPAEAGCAPSSSLQSTNGAKARVNRVPPGRGAVHTLPGFPPRGSTTPVYAPPVEAATQFPKPASSPPKRKAEEHQLREVKPQSGKSSPVIKATDSGSRGGRGRALKIQAAMLSAAVLPVGGVAMVLWGPGAVLDIRPSTTVPREEVVVSRMKPRPAAFTASWTLARAASPLGPLTVLPVDPNASAAPGTAVPPQPATPDLGIPASAEGAAPAPAQPGSTAGAQAALPGTAKPAGAGVASKGTSPPVPQKAAPSASGQGRPAQPASGAAPPPAPSAPDADSAQDSFAAFIAGAEKVVTLVSKELDGAYKRLKDPASLIHHVWGPEGPRALVVAICESNLNVAARSPHGYEGIFQLGPFERLQYGAGADARSQVEAAHRLFKARGWEPWPVCARPFM